MIKIIKKIKNKKGSAQYQKRKISSSGFVILFAVTITSLILAVALGITNIALKEVKFGTSAKDTNEAFFAADTGVEYVLLKDKNPASYPPPASGTSSWNETIGGLGSLLQGCVKVNIVKTPSVTTFVSKGYNNGSGGSAPNWTCTPNSTSSIEREIKVSY